MLLGTFFYTILFTESFVSIDTGLLLGSGVASEAQSNLFVEATLLRSDSDGELNQILDGSKVIRISTGVFATFKKLKILSTSQQQGTLFRLKFQLKRYVGNVFEIIDGASVTSNPIEVFSHTQYLNERKNGKHALLVANSFVRVFWQSIQRSTTSTKRNGDYSNAWPYRWWHSCSNFGFEFLRLSVAANEIWRDSGM